jgi:CBS domain-containing protein
VLCPFCRTDNVPGIDDCVYCGQDLTAFDTPGRRDELEVSLVDLPVEDLQPVAPVLVAPETSLAQVVERLRERRIGAVLVGTPDELLGIFSERDLLLRVADRYPELRDEPVSRFMTPDPETVEADAPIAFALNRMEVGDFRHVPVTRGGRLCGMISTRDVVEFLAQRYPELIPPLAAE